MLRAIKWFFQSMKMAPETKRAMVRHNRAVAGLDAAIREVLKK